jgi:hypothetical protein
MRSTSTSSLPPLAFWPNMRAGMTWVLLNTSRSPGVELVKHIDKMTVAQGAGLTIELHSRRLAVRSAMG